MTSIYNRTFFPKTKISKAKAAQASAARFAAEKAAADKWDQWTPKAAAFPPGFPRANLKILPEDTVRVLSRHGYGIEKAQWPVTFLTSLKKHLTVRPVKKGKEAYGGGANGDDQSFPIYQESATMLYLPRHEGMRLFGPPKKNLLEDGGQPLREGLEFRGEPREKQQDVIAAFRGAFQEKGGGVLCVGCGFGKTFLAIYLFSQVVRRKTLVVVAQENLLNQWKDQLKQWLPDALVGEIRGKTVDIEGKDVVIGMLQSISQKDYGARVFKDFGMVIYDEAHHLGAETFSKALLKCACPYTLGLTATPERDDGLHHVYMSFLGPIAYQELKRDVENVQVHLVRLSSTRDEYRQEKYTDAGNVNLAATVNQLCAFFPRTVFLLHLLARALQDRRNTLLLSERREHLVTLEKLVRLAFGSPEFRKAYPEGLADWDPDAKMCLYVGGMKATEMDRAHGCSLVLGTYHMAAEGMDLPHLNTLILTSQRKKVTQPCGRIFRRADPAFPPVIMDIQDGLGILSGQRRERQNYYKSSEYHVHVQKASLDVLFPDLPLEWDGKRSLEVSSLFPAWSMFFNLVPGKQKEMGREKGNKKLTMKPNSSKEPPVEEMTTEDLECFLGDD